MKKSISTIYFTIYFFLKISLAQNCMIGEPTPPTILALFESKNGWVLPASGTMRILVVLPEVNYDVGTDPHGPPADWLPGQLPPWINSFLDVNAPSTGSLTNYFNVASSGNYTVLEDFLKPTTGTGVFTINTI